MITFYAAVGCYRIKTEDGRKTAYIQKLGKYGLRYPCGHH